jgi:hypothetical protein
MQCCRYDISIPDPHQRILVCLTQKTDTKVSKIRFGMFIPDHGSGFFSFQDPDPGVQKAPHPGVKKAPDPQHCYNAAVYVCQESTKEVVPYYSTWRIFYHNCLEDVLPSQTQINTRVDKRHITTVHVQVSIIT